MFESIKINKFKSGIIISIFILIITLITYYICMTLDFGYFSIIFALIFSILSAYATFYNCDKIVLSMNKARPATEDEYIKLNKILDSLMIGSGLSYRPKLYVVDDDQPNAFATGRNPEHSVICVTTALLDKLNYYELEGVLAHELSHIYNYDIRLSAIITVMVGVIVMLSDMTSRRIIYSRKNDDNDRNSNSILLLLGAICLIISPIFSKLLQLSVSRKREFLADATAIQFTRNPEGLISALEKISSNPNELKNASNSTAHMYISNPFRKKKISNLLSTHPSIEDRIEALRSIK